MQVKPSKTYSKMDYALCFKRIRTLLGFTQEDMAEIFQCGSHKISRIENGRTGITLEDLRILTLIGVDPRRFLQEPDDYPADLQDLYSQSVAYYEAGELQEVLTLNPRQILDATRRYPNPYDEQAHGEALELTREVGDEKSNNQEQQKSNNRDIGYHYSRQQATESLVAESASAYSARPIKPLLITVKHDNTEEIALIPMSVSAGYARDAVDLTDDDLIPKGVSLPGLRDVTYRAFQVQGDSMESTLRHSDIVVASYVEDLYNTRKQEVMVVVTHDDVHVKRITRHEDHFVMVSDNDYYEPVRLEYGDIKELWRVERVITGYAGTPPERHWKDIAMTLRTAFDASQRDR